MLLHFYMFLIHIVIGFTVVNAICTHGSDDSSAEQNVRAQSFCTSTAMYRKSAPEIEMESGEEVSVTVCYYNH